MTYDVERVEGCWYWVRRVGDDEWFPARWTMGEWINEDTWFDFHDEIKEWLRIPAPPPGSFRWNEALVAFDRAVAATWGGVS